MAPPGSPTLRQKPLSRDGPDAKESLESEDQSPEELAFEEQEQTPEDNPDSLTR